jgi:hypothetical protein
VLAQMIFHSPAEEVDVIDVIALEPAVAFGEHDRGAPLSLALRIPPGDIDPFHDVLDTFDSWALRMAIVAVEIEWIDGAECLTLTDVDGDEVVLQIGA